MKRITSSYFQSRTSTCQSRESPETCVDPLSCGGQTGRRRCGNWSFEKDRVWHTDAASSWERDWQDHIKSWRYQLELCSKNMFRHEEHRVSGTTHGVDFVVAGPRDSLAELKNKFARVCPIKTKIITYWSTESTKALNRRLVPFEEARICGAVSRLINRVPERDSLVMGVRIEVILAVVRATPMSELCLDFHDSRASKLRLSTPRSASAAMNLIFFST